MKYLNFIKLLDELNSELFSNLKNLKINVLEKKNLDFIKSNLWTTEFWLSDLERYISYLKKTFKYEILENLTTNYIGIEPGSHLYFEKYEIENVFNYVPFVRTSEFGNYQLNFDTLKFLEKDVYELSTKLMKPKVNDIFYTKDGQIGNVAILKENYDFIYGSGLINFRLKEKSEITSEYLFLVLALPIYSKLYVKKYTVIGSTIPHMNKSHILNFIIPILDKKRIDYYTREINKII